MRKQERSFRHQVPNPTRGYRGAAKSDNSCPISPNFTHYRLSETAIGFFAPYMPPTLQGESSRLGPGLG